MRFIIINHPHLHSKQVQGCTTRWRKIISSPVRTYIYYLTVRKYCLFEVTSINWIKCIIKCNHFIYLFIDWFSISLIFIGLTWWCDILISSTWWQQRLTEQYFQARRCLTDRHRSRNADASLALIVSPIRSDVSARPPCWEGKGPPLNHVFKTNVRLNINEATIFYKYLYLYYLYYVLILFNITSEKPSESDKPDSKTFAIKKKK